MVGLTRFELVTPRLSSVCSNQLSYRPRYSLKEPLPVPSKLDRRAIHKALSARSIFDKAPFTLAGSGEPVSRKEVIQPQVLLQLPCYDFTPITDHTLDASLPYGLMWRLLVQPAFVM
jgi:hypothetical protein